MSFKYYVIWGGGHQKITLHYKGGGTGGVKKGLRNFLMFPKEEQKYEAPPSAFPYLNEIFPHAHTDQHYTILYSTV